MLRHKRVLIAVRLVFLVMIASLAIPELLKGELSLVLPIILGAYLLTNLAMIPEKSRSFFTQRVQAFLIFFDIFVLVVSLAALEKYRQDLVLSMFLVVLLASASQKLSVSIGGFLAIAAFYAWFYMRGEDGIQWTALTTGLPVLLVVAIYVGYVSESVARERRQRLEFEDRLSKELRGMNRAQALLSNMSLETEPQTLFQATLDSAQSLFGTPTVALCWARGVDAPYRTENSETFPAGACERWVALPADRSPLMQAVQSGKVLRVSSASQRPADAEWARAAREHGIETSLLAPFQDRVGGYQGCLVVAWTTPHPPVPVEEEAAQTLMQQASVCLENSALCKLLSQARDVWQAAFTSVPTPVVIVDKNAGIVQANPAFMALGEFDLASLIGSSFSEMLNGATHPNGRPLEPEEVSGSAYGVIRLRIPRLGGEFDVTRGPYLGYTDAGPGIVWVLRKLTAEVVAG